jgi:hypothetical protein
VLGSQVKAPLSTPQSLQVASQIWFHKTTSPLYSSFTSCSLVPCPFLYYTEESTYFENLAHRSLITHFTYKQVIYDFQVDVSQDNLIHLFYMCSLCKVVSSSGTWSFRFSKMLCLLILLVLFQSPCLASSIWWISDQYLFDKFMRLRKG